MAYSSSQNSILWAHVALLALLQGAITLMWVIYGLYLPQLLTQFGFPQSLAVGLLVVENLLAVVMEPLMGSLSDRAQHSIATRFPMITAGVLLSAVLFISIPTIVVIGNVDTAQRWILPAALIAWALAMTVFRSPALSLLGQYASNIKLPMATSLLILIQTLIGRFAALTSQLILSWGPMTAFAIGGGVLLATTTGLRCFNPQATVKVEEPESDSQPISWFNLVLIFGIGIGVALGFALLNRTVLAPKSAQPEAALMMNAFFLFHLVSVIPAGHQAKRLGNERAMLIGLGTLVGGLVILAIAPASSLAIGLVAILGIAWSFAVNGTIPFALTKVPPSRAGLGIGLFFSGGALAAGVLGIAAVWVKALSSTSGALFAGAAFAVAGLCVWISQKRHVK